MRVTLRETSSQAVRTAGCLSVLVLSTVWLDVRAQDCCADSQCRMEATRHAAALQQAAAFLPRRVPGTVDSAVEVMDSLRSFDRERYLKWARVYGAYVTWCESVPLDALRPLCVYDLLEADSVTSDWMGVQAKLDYRKGKVISPEFRRGWHLQTEFGLGAVDLATDQEGAYGGLRGLLSFTWGHRKGMPLRATGGTWRVLAGPELIYSRSEARLALDARLAHRIKDMGPDLVSVANLQLFAECLVAEERTWLGGGVHAEAHRLGIGAAVLADAADGGVLFRLSFAYRFPIQPRFDSNPQYDRP